MGLATLHAVSTLASARGVCTLFITVRCALACVCLHVFIAGCLDAGCWILGDGLLGLLAMLIIIGWARGHTKNMDWASRWCTSMDAPPAASEAAAAPPLPPENIDSESLPPAAVWYTRARNAARCA